MQAEERKPHLIPAWIEQGLIGEPFWSLWGGRVFHTVIVSAIVVFFLHFIEGRVRELVDTTVQSTLLNRMAEADFVAPSCSEQAGKGWANCISVIGINDDEFREVFKQQSPLDPSILQKLFEKFLLNPPRILAIDLDLSPSSKEDLPKRELLKRSLLDLSKVTRVVMVCPQGYSTPKPSELDRQWVRSFGSNIKFASADLDADGLYYIKHKSKTFLQTLGVMTVNELESSAKNDDVNGSSATVDWDAACSSNLSSLVGAIEAGNKKLIRPSSVYVSSFSKALTSPESFSDRVVLVGGKWGITDRFVLRGQSDQFFGVTLHSWVVASELIPTFELPAPATLILEVFIGLLSGFAFAGIWRGVDENSTSFARRSFFYSLFFAMAICVPVAFVIGAAQLAKIGLTLGVAGMILSAGADSVLSSHERLLDHEHKESYYERIGVNATQTLTTTSFGIFGFITSGILYFAGWHLIGWIMFGCAVGLVLAVVDSKKFHVKKNATEKTLLLDIDEVRAPGDKDIFSAATWHLFDLLLRFVWICFKAYTLVWALGLTLESESGLATIAMVFSFIFSWVVAFIWIRSTHKSSELLK